MKIPFFPLNLVAFPGEQLNLHIFEPRYKQLIEDVETSGITFGICIYNEKLIGFGTEVKLDGVYKRYENGTLDIRTVGIRPFKITSFENPLEGKLYAGGEVEFLEDDLSLSNVKHFEFLFYLKEILHLLNHKVEVVPDATTSFTYAHKIGLKLEEEIELLTMSSESQRIDFLINYFKRMIPAFKAIETAKEKIRQNGHFKHLDALDF